MRIKRPQLVALGIGLSITLIDGGIKQLVLNGEVYQVFGAMIHLVENAGLVFGIPVSEIGLTIILLLAIVLVVDLIIRTWIRSPELSGGALLILIGAISNIVDRLQHGFVVDWADFGNRWPVFNGADLLIAIGLFWYLFAQQLTSRSKN